MDKDGYDAIVVGGGPAGSTAAYLLRRIGLSVALLDRNRFPRPKLCGGLITHKTMRLLDRVFGETPESLEEKGIIDFKSDHYEVYCRRRPIAAESVTVPFYFVDRYLYDNYFLRRAEEAGAEILEGEAAKRLDLERKEIATTGGRTLRANFIIGADGANSIIRQGLPYNLYDKARWQSGLATGLEACVSIDDLEADSHLSIDHPIIVFDFVSWGYCWIFPNRNRLVVGIGGLNKKNKGQFASMFRNFTSTWGLTSGLTTIKGHPVPYGNFLALPALRDVLLAGDAAGLVDPITGEGIFYAHRSAELAVLAIRSAISGRAASADVYVNLLSRHIYPELRYAKHIRWWIFEVSSRLQHRPTATVLNLLGNRCVEVVHGIRSYRWLRRSDLNLDSI